MFIRVIITFLILFHGNAHAENPKDIYELIGSRAGIPKEVLYALALTESGITTLDGNYQPWPYTLNWRGIPYRFNEMNRACEALSKILEVSNAIDIGETQLHWKYQKESTDEPCSFFDRYTAIKRTASIMKQCKSKHKNWVLAAGCYHRPSGGELARKYEKKFLINLKKTIAEDW